MSEKRQLSSDDLESHLGEQIQFLQASAAAFDSGFEGEAKRLAVTLRVLLHNTSRSHSLLSQLNKQDQRFLDTAVPPEEGNLLPHGGLVFIASGPPRTRYVAMLDDVPLKGYVGFAHWWHAPVFRDADGATLTRRDLVLVAANQDGGAHVDPGLDERYARLSRDNAMGWVTAGPEGARPMEGPERAAIRQIAHEVLKTLLTDYSAAPRHNAGVIFGGVTVKRASATPGVPKVGRNDPCHCGSGKKFKKCHG